MTPQSWLMSQLEAIDKLCAESKVPADRALTMRVQAVFVSYLMDSGLDPQEGYAESFRLFREEFQGGKSDG